MFVPLLGLYCRTVIRGRIREQKGIEGSCFKDLLCVWCLPFCSLAQEAQVNTFGCISGSQFLIEAVDVDCNFRRCSWLFIVSFFFPARNWDQEDSPWPENN